MKYQTQDEQHTGEALLNMNMTHINEAMQCFTGDYVSFFVGKIREAQTAVQEAVCAIVLDVCMMFLAV